jgi:hypothetical protein
LLKGDIRVSAFFTQNMTVTFAICVDEAIIFFLLYVSSYSRGAAPPINGGTAPLLIPAASGTQAARPDSPTFTGFAEYVVLNRVIMLYHRRLSKSLPEGQSTV